MKPRRSLLVFAGLSAVLSCSEDTTAPPRDNTHPSAPTGLVATQVSRAHVRLTWQPSTDNVGVTGYTMKVYDVNNGRHLPEIPSSGPECVDTLAIPWEPTRYNVVAWDAAGNGQTSEHVNFIVMPTAADVAGTWRLASCDPGSPPGVNNVCAEAITFTINADSTITGSMTNVVLVAAKGNNAYETTTIGSASLSGRYSGRTLRLAVSPVSGTDRNLTEGTIDITIAARPPAGRAWRLRQAQGTYSFAGNKYSYIDLQWFNAYNNGTISFVR